MKKLLILALLLLLLLTFVVPAGAYSGSGNPGVPGQTDPTCPPGRVPNEDGKGCAPGWGGSGGG